MTQKTFEYRMLTQALAVTSKVKEKLEPFIAEICKGNIEWTFLVFSELYQYLSLGETELNHKFNSLVATKVIMDTCEFSAILIVEVYFLPLIKKIACYQVNLPQKSRGVDYFPNNGYEKSGNAKKLGYNFVRLACEIINMFSIVKPYELYKNEEVSQPSEFALAFESMRSQGWKEYDQLAFYHQDPLRMRALYLENLQNFEEHLTKYQNFIRSSLENSIRKDLFPIGLDPRKIVQFHELYASNFTLQLIKQFALSCEAVALTNVLRLISEMIRWGNIGAIHTIESQTTFDHLIEMVENAEADAGNHYKGKYGFERILGTQPQKMDLYLEILKSLQIWAACIPKSFKDAQKDSKSTALFKKMAFEKNIKFPTVSNIRKIRNECYENMEKYKRLNQKWLKYKLHKTTVRIPKNRRPTMQLRQLLNPPTGTGKLRKSVVFNDSTIMRQKSKGSVKHWKKQTNVEQVGILNQTMVDNLGNSQRSSAEDEKSPFTKKFYRQKKKKGYQFYQELHDALSKTQTSNFKTVNFQDQQEEKRRRSDADSGPNKIAMLKTIHSDFQSNYTDNSSDLSDQQTLYSQQVEQGKVQPVIKSIQNKMSMKNLFNDKLCTSISKCEQQTVKQVQANSRVSIVIEEDSKSDEKMEFFSSPTSKSSSFCRPEVKHIHEINIFPPTQIHHIEAGFKKQSNSQKQNYVYHSQLAINQPKKAEVWLEKLEQKVSYLEQQNKNLKNELEKKEKQLASFKSNENDSFGSIRDEKNKKFSWTSFLFGDEQPAINYSENKLSQLKKKAESKPQQLIKLDQFKNEMAQLDGLTGKKLIKNKDLLLRTQNIEIGFLFQLEKDIGKVIFYLTPEKDLSELKYKLILMDNIKCSETSQTMQSIAKKKQRKICFSFKVNPPYLLPKLMLSYSLQGNKYNNNVIVPISYNKFVTFQHPSTAIPEPLIQKKSHIQMINKKLFSKKQVFSEYFNCSQIKNQNQQDQQLKSSVSIRNKPVDIFFTILNEDFIQIQYATSQRNQQISGICEFLVMTLLTIVKK